MCWQISDSPFSDRAMNHLIALVTMLGAVGTAATESSVPLASGRYVFEHRFAEHPSMPSISVDVVINGSRIVISNPAQSNPFPAGVLAQGQLMQHAGSAQWIIGNDESDRWAEDVGGCSDGPEVVDLAAKIYWTC